jgi:hypothetical protein
MKRRQRPPDAAEWTITVGGASGGRVFQYDSASAARQTLPAFRA